MDALKPIIAKNIAELRTAKGITQIELAEYLNYSDKAVSKWERAESVPDVAVLKKISELFGVTLDYLVQPTHEKATAPSPAIEPEDTRKNRNHHVITGMSIFFVWLIATLTFVIVDIVTENVGFHWVCFLFAVPISLIVWLIFNSIWFNPRTNFWIVSLLVWSILASIHLSFLHFGINLWMVYLLGIPGQIIIILWSRLVLKSREKAPNT